MDELLKSNNGYLLSKDVVSLGISKTFLAEYVITHKLQRVAQGVYISPDVWQDDLFILSLKNSKAILSYETALQLHGLTERESNVIHVTVSYGYNATHLRKKGVCVHQVKDELLYMGMMKVKTNYSNIVTAYDMERTICDIVKTRDKMDSQSFQYAIKEYTKSKDKKLGNLMRYAKLLGVVDDMQKYMEVLL